MTVGREMRPAPAGTFDVLEDGVLLATHVPFEVAHEFVHTGCVRCATGEDHVSAVAD